MTPPQPPQNRTRSQALQQRAEHFFPGGVNSPVRAFRAVGGAPPFVESAQGAYLTDADGNRYIDYFGSWGPMILGHAFPPVVEAIERAAHRSASFGASTAAEADLAERIVACSNNLAGFGLKKGLDHFAAVREKLLAVTGRFAAFQAQWLNVHVEFPLLQHPR